MKWNIPEDGYEFRVHLLHGGHSGFVKSIRCSLDDFDKYVQIFSNLQDAITAESSTEEVAERIAKITGHNVAKITNIIEPVVMSDITTHNSQMANVEYVEVNRFEGGQMYNLPLDVIEFYMKNSASNTVSRQKP